MSDHTETEFPKTTIDAVEEWRLPKEPSKIEQAFGAAGRVSDYLPPRDLIPKEFDNWGNKWNRTASSWFHKGLPEGTKFIPKEGVDTEKALTHLATVLRSFEPKHEHKLAGVGWLMSLWFEDIQIP